MSHIEAMALKEGEKKGLEKGRKKGWHEHALMTARRMLAKGYDISTIAELTGLSEQEIVSLKD